MITELPLIVSQSGAGDPTEPPTLATAARWTFCLVYTHEHAARDRVALTLEINLSPPAAIAGTDGNGPDGGGDWVASLSHPFSAVVACKAGPARELESYRLTRRNGAAGPDLGWPEVACQAADGSWAPLIVETGQGATRSYRPEPGAALMLDAWPSFALSWPGLNAGNVQNMRTSLEAVRDADPPGPEGPATADASAERTAIVTGADIVTPHIHRSETLPITGATIEAALQAAFDSLFPPAARRDDFRLTFGLHYGYALAPGPDPLTSEIAVALIADHLLTGRTAAMVAEALQRWQDEVAPTTAGGFWLVSLKLHSGFDPGRPVLLSLDRLTYAAG
jgi:hypothetical protein